MPSAPIILVPGFWLGAWAWDDVAARLRADGHDVTAITLPGQRSVDEDRSQITLADHVAAITDAVHAAKAPVVLAVHSATGIAGYAASDQAPDRIAAMVYVDSSPGISPFDPEHEGDKDLPSAEELAAEENLDGLSEEQLAAFRERAIPVPGGVLRGTVPLTNGARRDIPTTIICTGFPSDEVKAAAEKGFAWLAGIPELHDITWVDLPTSHWPMWSKPAEIAAILGDVATNAGTGD
jgi:pimeloyl-ACP methyl ester carboxylesterase